MASHKTGSRCEGRGLHPPGPRPRPPPQHPPEGQGGGYSRSYHSVSVSCSTILVAGRPLVPSQPRLISRTPPGSGVMHCGKATSKEGKWKGCAYVGTCFERVRIVNKRTGLTMMLLAAVAHVRCCRIQGCLIRQVMIAKDRQTAWDCDRDWASSTSSTSRSKQSSKHSVAPPARARHPSPTRFSPTASRHPQQAGGLRKARRGKARQGNVRQCKARQGNKAVALSVPCPCFRTCYPLVLAQSAAFGTREHEDQGRGR